MAGVRATFTADFETFYRAVEKADVSLKTFADGAATVDKRLTTLGNAFSGVKIIQEAHLMAKAVEDAGGTANLTEKELKKLGTTVGEASEKMRKMGVDVPPGFQKINEATESLTHPTKSWSQSLGDVSTVIQGLLALKVVQWMKEAITATLDYADQLENLSISTGITTGGLQRLESIGVTAHVSMETLAKSVEMLHRKLDDPKAIQAIEQMGLNYAAIRDLSPEQQFLQIAQSIAAIEDPVDKANVGALLFGKTWDTISPAINSHMDDILKNTVIMSDGTVKALDRAGDKWDEFYLNSSRRVKAFLGDLVLAAEEAKLNWDDVLDPASLFSKLGTAQHGLETPALPSAPKLKIGAGPEDIGGVAQFIKDSDAQFAQSTEKRKAAAKSAQDLADTLAKANKELLSLSVPLTKAQDDQARSLLKLNALSDAQIVTLSGVTTAQLSQLKSTVKIEQSMVTYKFAMQALQSPLEGLNKTFIAAGEIQADGTLAFNDYTYGLQSTQVHVDALGNAIADKGIPNIKKLTDVTREAGQSLSAGLMENLKAIPGLLTQAFTGGGGVLGAVKGIGSLVGSTLGKSVGESISTASKGLGSLAGPLGAAIGALAGPLISKIASIFKGSEESLKVSPLRDEFFKMAGGLEVLNPKVLALTGNLSAVDAILKAKTLDQYNAALKNMTDILGLQDQAMADLVATAQKYGFTLEELGPALQRQNLDAQAQALYKDFQILVSGGLDNVAVLTRMSDSVNDYLHNALKMGIEVPAAMRPMLEAMATQGTLTDAAGNKISNLEDAGISFALTMSDGFKALISTVEKLTNAIAQGLGLAIEHIPEPTIKVHYDLSELPSAPDYSGGQWGNQDQVQAATGGMITPFGLQYFARGGHVLPFRPRGTDTVPAMLTPGETVRTKSQEAKLHDGPSNADVVDAIHALRSDLATKFPRANARAVAAALVGIRTAS